MSSQPSRLLVVRLGSMGDILHTLPAVATLRAAFPNANIGWAVERRWASLLSSDAAMAGPRSPQKPLVDVVHAVDTHAWRSAPFSGKTWREARSAVREIRDQRYEVAIDFQGAWKSAILAQLSRVPRRLGFMQPREKPATLFYTHQVAARGRHIVEQNLSLANAIAPDQSPEFCFPLPQDPSADHAAQQQLRDRGFHGFAIVNPGAGWGAKCWPAERYAEVMRALAVHGLRSMVNFGPGEEDLARAVESAAGAAASAMSSSVAELIALTRRARLFVGGDTGPMHLAAALDVPIVALFGPTDPARSGPYTERAIVLRSPSSRTTMSHRPEPDAGLLELTAEEVIAAARYLLAQAASSGVRP
ncbi:MAG: glycosyltransferase family 9 protein [Terriglobales bacterium]